MPATITAVEPEARAAERSDTARMEARRVDRGGVGVAVGVAGASAGAAVAGVGRAVAGTATGAVG